MDVTLSRSPGPTLSVGAPTAQLVIDGHVRQSTTSGNSQTQSIGQVPRPMLSLSGGLYEVLLTALNCRISSAGQ